MKINEDLRQELIALSNVVSFHQSQLTDAVRRMFLAMNVPLASRLNIETGEVEVPEPEKPAEEPTQTEQPSDAEGN